MSEEEDQASLGSVPSPCVRNCCLDEQSVCLGCYRTITEICEWHAAPDAVKIEILGRCRSRYRQRFAGITRA